MGRSEGRSGLDELARRATALSVLLEHDEDFSSEFEAATKARDREVQNVLLGRIGCTIDDAPGGGGGGGGSGTFCFTIFNFPICITITIVITTGSNQP
jgi:hypothetical protein